LPQIYKLFLKRAYLLLKNFIHKACDWEMLDGERKIKGGCVGVTFPTLTIEVSNKTEDR